MERETKPIPTIGQTVYDRGGELGGTVTAVFEASTKGPYLNDAWVAYRDAWGQTRQAYVSDLEWEEVPPPPEPSKVKPLDVRKWHAMVVELEEMLEAAIAVEGDKATLTHPQIAYAIDGGVVPQLSEVNGDYWDVTDKLDDVRFLAGVLLTNATAAMRRAKFRNGGKDGRP